MQNKLWVVAGLLLLVALVAARYVPREEARLPATQYAENTERYDITAHYASSTPLRESAGAAADKRAVEVMRAFVAGVIEEFKKTGHPDRKTSLQTVYMISSGTRTVSYIYTIYADTGGAHGNTTFRTFTFDTRTGSLLALPDLFVSGSTYLEELSRVSRAQLPEIIGGDADREMIALGTEPKAENFARFFIAGDKLGILFPPYQVAPYAAGPQTLPIPLSDLSAILKPEYR